jgi:hypothetical protein
MDMRRVIVPEFSTDICFPEAFLLIQNFINSLEYNYTGIHFVKPKKSGGMLHLVEVFNEIIFFGCPIQCVEAVFLAIVLSSQYEQAMRIPLCFESKCDGFTHLHIVLAVYYCGKWGSLGISRRECLMFKPLAFNSLWSLIEEFRKSYESVLHSLQIVSIGKPISHNLFVDQLIVWKSLRLRMGQKYAVVNRNIVESFLSGIFRSRKMIPNPRLNLHVDPNRIASKSASEDRKKKIKKDKRLYYTKDENET